MKITSIAVSSILVSVACAQTSIPSIPQSDIDAYNSLKSAFNAAAAPQLAQAKQDREAMHDDHAKYQAFLSKTHPLKKEVYLKVYSLHEVFQSTNRYLQNRCAKQFTTQKSAMM